MVYSQINKCVMINFHSPYICLTHMTYNLQLNSYLQQSMKVAMTIQLCFLFQHISNSHMNECKYDASTSSAFQLHIHLSQLISPSSGRRKMNVGVMLRPDEKNECSHSGKLTFSFGEEVQRTHTSQFPVDTLH